MRRRGGHQKRLQGFQGMFFILTRTDAYSRAQSGSGIARTVLELCWNYADTGAKQSGIVAAQQQLQNDNSKQRYGIIGNSTALENGHH